MVWVRRVKLGAFLHLSIRIIRYKRKEVLEPILQKQLGLQLSQPVLMKLNYGRSVIIYLYIYLW